MDVLVKETDMEIKLVLKKVDSTILSSPGINHTQGAIIISEIGDMDRFDTPDKILAYAGLSPSTYQSGKLESIYAKMEKRGSRYLRYALFNAARFVSNWDPTFKVYLTKKRAEGKHYSVALSHVTKKLIRLIFAFINLDRFTFQWRKVLSYKISATSCCLFVMRFFLFHFLKK